MNLSSDLISDLVKVTNSTTKTTKNESTVYGTIVSYKGSKYVQLDGSDLLTPISTTADMIPGERVTVLIKNHTATVTGNISSPAARSDDVKDLSGEVVEVGLLIADKVSTEELEAERARIANLEASNVTVTEKLTANEAEIENLKATHGEFETLTAEKFEAIDASIENLDVENLDAKYANIDFTNIGKAAMEYFYANSGLIENVVVGDATISGNLVGVTISGDLIEGNTVVAEKLVIKGEDGLYYKLNTDGIKVEAEQTDYNSINGSVIKAKSITATKISVSDLVAFDATIGGFNITDGSIYSGVKETADNTTRGIYLDKDGQAVIGDSNNFIKYYKDSNGDYILDISAKSISFSSSGTDIESAIDDAAKTATNFMGFDSTNGLQIGDKSSGSWSGFRTQITSSAYNILNSAGTILASYGEKLIELGKNATDAVIKLCGGKGQIEYVSDEDTSDEYLQVTANKLRLKSDGMSSLYSVYSDGESIFRKSAVNVSPNKVHIYASECIDPGSPDKVESWNLCELTVDTDAVSIVIPGSMTIDASSINDTYGQIVSVIEGNSGMWTYKKWSNGYVELYGTYNVINMECNNALGSMYRTLVFSPGTFPFSVYDPNVVASYESDGYGAMLWATTTTTTENLSDYYLLRPTSATIVNGKINFHVTGRWK